MSLYITLRGDSADGRGLTLNGGGAAGRGGARRRRDGDGSLDLMAGDLAHDGVGRMGGEMLGRGLSLILRDLLVDLVHDVLWLLDQSQKKKRCERWEDSMKWWW